jgi:murein DD-endopeptidase MepM/ murein hydrolase activator NlpD
MILIKEYLNKYQKTKLIVLNLFVNKLKTSITDVFLLGRGKYSSSVLNTSFIIGTLAALIITPGIAQNTIFNNLNPALAKEQEINAENYEISTLVSEKPPDRIIEYQVQLGENLLDIAEKFKYTNVKSIKLLNKLTTNTINSGKIIQIPPIDGAVHTVYPGETIYTIAKKYEVDPQNILNYPFNDFENQETYQLKQGQILYVPGGQEVNTRNNILEGLTYKEIATSTKNIVNGLKGTGSLSWPTQGIITQYPIWYHNAFDIANNVGTPVKSADSGTVSYSDCIGTGYGCHIIVDHGNGTSTLYAHLSKRNIQVGQNVSKDAEIGLMGSTGRSTGSHLHFEVRIDGKTTNPGQYFK